MTDTGLLRLAVGALLLASSARAQSAELLEGVRVHRPEIAALARAEVEACQRQRCPALERLQLLTGLLELSDGEAQAAAARLASSKPPRGLEPFHAWYLGLAQAWAGERAQAVKTLERAKKKAPAWLAARVPVRQGELLLDLGQYARARPLLEAAATAQKGPETLFSRALVRRALKAETLARADLRQVALTWPAHPHGRSARALLEASEQWALTFDEAVSRAQALLAAGDASGCLAALEGLTAPASAPPAEGARVSEPAARLALVRGQALLARGRERDAEALAALALAAEGPPSHAAQALLLTAKRLMRLQDNAQARAAFKQLDTRYPQDPASDEGAYLGAWLAMNSGDFEAAVADFEAFEARHATSRRRDEARWFRGFTHLRAGRHAEAREVLLTLPRDFQRSSLVPQALYWAARCASLGAAGAGLDAGAPPVDVAAEYREVVRAFPGTFYALAASERLKELGVEQPLPFTVAPKALTVKRPARLELAAALAQAGLFRDAAQEVGEALRQATAAEALTWGHALQALGDYHAAHALAARHLWGPVYAQRSPEALALMYPRAFQPSVEAWSKAHGVEPALAWAIMRRESAFQPEVTSAADARGLMQIIPPTARAIAKELKIAAPDEAELYSPDTNVRLGTWYLRALTERLQHPTLVAGAYNGGPSAVARWAKERGAMPLDQWVEEIPYRETRGYVKQVTVDLFIYRQLYGGPAERLSLEVPTPRTAGVDF